MLYTCVELFSAAVMVNTKKKSWCEEVISANRLRSVKQKRFSIVAFAGSMNDDVVASAQDVEIP